MYLVLSQNTIQEQEQTRTQHQYIIMKTCESVTYTQQKQNEGILVKIVAIGVELESVIRGN